MSSRMIQSILLSGMTVLLIACGGGGSSGKTAASAATSSLSGVAAIGAALTSASVTLKDSTGKTATATTNESGNFSFNDVSSFTPPLMLQVKGTVAGQSYVLHSMMTSTPAQGTNTLNVTPATEAITTQTLGADPEVTFDDPAKIKKIDPQKLADSKAKLVAALNDAMANLKINNLDLMTGKFSANKTGMDKLFDLVDFSADSSTGAMKLTNKNTSVSTTVSSGTNLSDVKKIELSEADASLDMSGIDLFVQNLVKVFSSNDKNTLQLIFDKDYLHQGTNFAKLSEDVNTEADGTDFSGAGYVVKKCDPIAKVCNGTLNLKFSDTGISYPLSMPIKQGTDGQWRAYGDQAPFFIDLYPLYARVELIDSASKKITQTKDAVGFYLDFTGDSCGECNDEKYKSAILEISFDSGTNYSSYLKLTKKTVNSSYSFMGLDKGNGDITMGESLGGLSHFFYQFEEKQFITDYNNALQSGKLRSRFKAFYQENYQGPPVVWVPPVLSPLFEPPSADSLQTSANPIKAQQLSIEEKTLGTGELKFSGKNIFGTYFQTIDPATKNGYGESFYYENVASFNGVVTPSKMKTLCLKNLKTIRPQTNIESETARCNGFDKAEFRIKQASLTSQNAQGGHVHLSKIIQ